MAAMTNILAAKVQDHIFMKTALAAPSNLWIGLSSTTPGSDGSNVTEPPGVDGYARVSTAGVDWTTATIADPSLIENATVVQFPTVINTAWVVQTHLLLWDSSTGGDLWAFAALDTAKGAAVGSDPSFPVNDLDFTLT